MAHPQLSMKVERFELNGICMMMHPVASQHSHPGRATREQFLDKDTLRQIFEEIRNTVKP
jgi:hypothetical protein